MRSASILGESQGASIDQQAVARRVAGDDGGQHVAGQLGERAAADGGLVAVVVDVVARVQLGHARQRPAARSRQVAARGRGADAHFHTARRQLEALFDGLA